MTEIERLKHRIAELPDGYVTKKTINGKEYFYLQWMEGRKTRSRILKGEEIGQYRAMVTERKALARKLKQLKRSELEEPVEELPFTSSVTFGADLIPFIEPANAFIPRNCIRSLHNYLTGPYSDKVCIIYGLRRTGKTTILKHEMLTFSAEQLARTAYIKCRSTDTLASINRDVKALQKLGIRYLFIDEATLMEDFIDGAALFSDVYAACGMKIVLSGTDSLGFAFAESQELYDRSVKVHTTFIPYEEHSRLLGIRDIDEYIRYGGTLKAGELDFEDDEVNAEEASFRDDETTRRYIDTAICRNIQHSLECYRDGRYLRHLRELYEKDELTNAINRIIEDENHQFTFDVITRVFKSHDLSSAAQMLRSSRDEDSRIDILDEIDRTQILKTLKGILDIKEKQNQQIGITEAHIAEIREYLKSLDLIESLNVETLTGASLAYTIFTQPGMRFCQAQALVYSLLKDEQINRLDKRIIKLISDRILEGVLGHMLEDIVIFETKRKLMPKRNGNRYEVFKLRFASGEYDMVIYDAEAFTCEIYEIKHSSKRDERQVRHLVNGDYASETESRFGKITRRCVLYKGENHTDGSGIEYRNVEEYLCSLYAR